MEGKHWGIVKRSENFGYQLQDIIKSRRRKQLPSDSYDREAHLQGPCVHHRLHVHALWQGAVLVGL